MTNDRNIGLVVDFSKGSKLALKWATGNLLKKGDTLFLIQVKPSKGDESCNLLWSTIGSPLIPLVEFRNKEVVHKYEVDLDPKVVSMLDTASYQKEGTVIAKLYWGDARDKLCNAIDDLKFDCLVMGSRGLGTIQRVLLRSVTNYVMTSATCHVPIVKDPSARGL